MCELLVGLPEVTVLGVDRRASVAAAWCMSRPAGRGRACAGCGARSVIKDRRRWSWSICRRSVARPGWCGASSAGRARRGVCDRVVDRGRIRAIAAPRLAMTDRAGRWVTVQVGRHGRTVNEVAGELGCDWHTVNDAVIAYGTALVDDDPDRIGDVDRARVGRDAVRPGRAVSPPAVVDLDRRRGRRPAPRRGRWSQRAGPCRWLAARGRRVAGEHRVGDVGSVGSVSGGVRHDAARRRPGRRPVPCREAGQPEARRVPPAGAERDPRSSGPQGRSALPVPAAVDQGRRTPRRPGPHQAAGSARRRRSPTARSAPPGTPRKSCAASTTTRSRPRPRVRRPARPRSPRRVLPDRGPLARPDPASAGGTRSPPGTTPT